ncbi:probable inactive leucine-rich repeat receptor-like protein kinase At3g03770 [Brassica napus]|uniref:probable inactive leucine-rich repeat receptor-like protein kinase At3g03770 n=1 Tax=Brassica napus TaxID=3708 RepID=UPI0006AB5BC1|nr:probable inactive leucine-rich repeat receptor-like protein kinase At3g03770 [Brassica napus]
MIVIICFFPTSLECLDGNMGRLLTWEQVLSRKGTPSNKDEDRVDIYDFGVILLELIVGRPLKAKGQVDVLKEELQASISGDDGARRSMVDPTVHRTCSDQSLKTMMEICVKFLLKDPLERPSIEDVLWNLQFASQVQEVGYVTAILRALAACLLLQLPLVYT